MVKFKDVWTFRKLPPEKEAEFRAWVRQRPSRINFGQIAMYHPVMRDEMIKVLQESLDIKPSEASAHSLESCQAARGNPDPPARIP